MGAFFTDEEKARIRYHMGYANVNAVEVYAAGVPAPIETQFLIEGAMNRVLEAAAPLVRKTLAILDGIEQQMVDDHELLAITEIGEIKINTKEQQKLEARYLRWQASLANILAVSPMPFDFRYGGGMGGGGLNTPVSH